MLHVVTNEVKKLLRLFKYFTKLNMCVWQIPTFLLRDFVKLKKSCLVV